MAYEVIVEQAPAYELLASLVAYLDKKAHKSFDLGPAWAASVKKQLPPAFDQQLDGLKAPFLFPAIPLLISLCPGRRDAAGFLDWLESLSEADLYSMLIPYWPGAAADLPAPLGEVKARVVKVFRLWDQHYFSKLDPALMDRLAAEAAALQARIPDTAPEDLVEQATNGMYLAPDAAPGVPVVRLAPQYHVSPLNMRDHYKGQIIILYPMETRSGAEGEPSIGLLRLTRALADESRLRMLRFLTGDTPRTFTEVVEFIGLAKSTVHHHMVTLRSAGLVRNLIRPEGDRWCLRPDAVDLLGSRLAAYLKGEPPHDL